jgi:hypothetical protein
VKKYGGLPTPQKMLRKKLRPEESPPVTSSEEDGGGHKTLDRTIELDTPANRQGGKSNLPKRKILSPNCAEKCGHVGKKRFNDKSNLF